jgi:hypothetical protein
MQTSSPYEPPGCKELPLALTPDVRSRKHWKTIGFLIFAFVPVACGMARLHMNLSIMHRYLLVLLRAEWDR